MNDIEEFLRRAAARAQQAQQQAVQRARTVTPPPVTYTPQVMDAEIVEAEEVTGDDVAEEVRRNLDTRDFHQRARKLAEHVRAADDVIEAHLHQAFEHRLGQLGATTSAPEQSTLDDEEIAAAKAQKPTDGPLDLRAMLSSPEQVRNAIIMSELINRPEHRW